MNPSASAYLLSLFSPKKEKRGFFKRKKAQKNPPSARASRGALRGLGWGLVCFAEVLLVFEHSLGPAPPVCSRAGLTRARSLNTVYSEQNAVKNWPPWRRDWHRLVQLTAQKNPHSSLNHVTDLPDAVLKWTLCTQEVRWKKKNFSRKASIRRKHPDFSFKVPRCP